MDVVSHDWKAQTGLNKSIGNEWVLEHKLACADLNLFSQVITLGQLGFLPNCSYNENWQYNLNYVYKIHGSPTYNNTTILSHPALNFITYT